MHLIISLVLDHVNLLILSPLNMLWICNKYETTVTFRIWKQSSSLIDSILSNLPR